MSAPSRVTRTVISWAFASGMRRPMIAARVRLSDQTSASPCAHVVLWVSGKDYAHVRLSPSAETSKRCAPGTAKSKFTKIPSRPFSRPTKVQVPWWHPPSNAATTVTRVRRGASRVARDDHSPRAPARELPGRSAGTHLHQALFVVESDGDAALVGGVASSARAPAADADAVLFRHVGTVDGKPPPRVDSSTSRSA